MSKKTVVVISSRILHPTSLLPAASNNIESHLCIEMRQLLPKDIGDCLNIFVVNVLTIALPAALGTRTAPSQIVIFRSHLPALMNADSIQGGGASRWPPSAFFKYEHPLAPINGIFAFG